MRLLCAIAFPLLTVLELPATQIAADTTITTPAGTLHQMVLIPPGQYAIGYREGGGNALRAIFAGGWRLWVLHRQIRGHVRPLPGLHGCY